MYGRPRGRAANPESRAGKPARTQSHAFKQQAEHRCMPGPNPAAQCLQHWPSPPLSSATAQCWQPGPPPAGAAGPHLVASGHAAPALQRQLLPRACRWLAAVRLALAAGPARALTADAGRWRVAASCRDAFALAPGARPTRLAVSCGPSCSAPCSSCPAGGGGGAACLRGARCLRPGCRVLATAALRLGARWLCCGSCRRLVLGTQPVHGRLVRPDHDGRQVAAAGRHVDHLDRPAPRVPPGAGRG